MRRRFHRLLGSVYLAALVVQTVIRFPYGVRRRQERHEPADLPERMLLSGLTVGGLALPLAYTATRRLDFADLPLKPGQRRVLGWLGIVPMIGSLWLFWRAHHDLGSNWSPTLEIGVEQTLVTTGIYARIRHPMYTSQALLAVAQLLLMPNWLAGPAGLLVFAALYLLRVPREEHLLREHFGESYTTYAAHTGRILPRLTTF